MVSLGEGYAYYNKLLDNGFKGEPVGGLAKRKIVLHDLDFIVKHENIPAARVAIKKAGLPGVKVELYIPINDYDRLKKALCSTTYESIHGRLMTGLRYSKEVH